MTTCISSYKTPQWRCQEFDLEGWNILSSSPCLGKWSNKFGVNWGWSPNREREAPKIWGWIPNQKRSDRAGDLRRGFGEHLPKKIWKFILKTMPSGVQFNFSSEINLFIFSQWQIEEFAENEHFDPSQIHLKCICVSENFVNSPLRSRAKPQLSTRLGAFFKNAFMV